MFASFSSQEFQEFLAAKPYMTEEEQRLIVQSSWARDILYRVAEAVGRVRREWKLDISVN